MRSAAHVVQLRLLANPYPPPTPLLHPGIKLYILTLALAFPAFSPDLFTPLILTWCRKVASSFLGYLVREGIVLVSPTRQLTRSCLPLRLPLRTTFTT